MSVQALPVDHGCVEHPVSIYALSESDKKDQYDGRVFPPLENATSDIRPPRKLDRSPSFPEPVNGAQVLEDSLMMVQIAHPEAMQCRIPNSVDSFLQTVTIQFMAVNVSDEFMVVEGIEVTNSSVLVWYLTDGDRHAEDPALDVGITWVLPPKSSVPCSVAFHFLVPGLPGQTSRLAKRISRALPTPLNITFRLQLRTRASSGLQCKVSPSLKVRCENQPLGLPTLESLFPAQADRDTVFGWSFCDNLRTLERVWMHARKVGRHIEVCCSSGRSYSFAVPDLKKIADRARTARTTEYSLDDVNADGFAAWALFKSLDAGDLLPYALKLKTSTSTGTATNFFRLPELDETGISISLRSPTDASVPITSARPFSKITVQWDAPTLESGDYISVHRPRSEKNTYESYFYVETKTGTKEIALDEGIFELRYYGSDDQPFAVSSRITVTD
eukprot:ANDGO_03601.mRNA.1 hypothetical protein